MKFINIFDQSLDSKTCEKIISLFESKRKLQKNMNTRNSQNKVAKKSTDIFRYFDENDEFSALLIEPLRKGIIDYTKAHPGLGYVEEWHVHEMYAIQRYLPNEGYFVWHSEAGGWARFPNPLNTRMLVWTFYLNDVPDGGTMFLEQDYTLEARQGRLVVFPGFWTHTHRGQVSNSTVKYIVTGWCMYKVNMKVQRRS